MKSRTPVLLGVVALVAAAVCAPWPSAAQEDAPVIGLFVVRHDLATGDTALQILPIATGSGGEVRPVRFFPRREGEKAEADSLLKVHPAYEVFRRGERIASFRVDEVVRAPFYCSELQVGQGRAELGKDVSALVRDSAALSWSTSVDGQPTRPRLTLLLALDASARAVGTQSRSRPLDVPLSEDETSTLTEAAFRALVSSGGAVERERVRIEDRRAYDFDLDGVPEHVVVAAADPGRGRRTVLLAGRFRGGRWLPLAGRGHINSRVDWGRGVRLLDVLDLDGDAIPEVVIEIGGYEAFRYEVLAYTAEGLEPVFSEVLFGC